MSNIPISQLPLAIGALSGSETVPIVQGGTTKQATVLQIANTATGFVPTSREIEAGVGLSGGGPLTANVTLDFAPGSLTPKTAPTLADSVVIVNAASSNAPAISTIENFYTSIATLPSLAIPNLTDDKLVIVKQSDGNSYYITPSALSLAAGNVPAGGTTGQYLAKASNTNYDTVWVTNSAVGTVTDFSAGNLSPLFTTNVATSTTTPALTFTLSNAGANTYFGNATGGSTAPSYTAAGALTKVDDTNVTLTLGGAPTTALLTAASLTLGWTGQLAPSRGGTGVSSLGNLTRVDDTNVTLTLGGTPTGALINSVSITAGWSGQLALSRGGTNANLTASNGGLVYSTGSALAILSGTATANQIPLSGSSAAPSWSTATYPATAAAGTVLAAGTANTIAGTVSPTLGVQQTTRGSLILANTAAGAFPVTVQSSNSTTAAWTLTLPVDAGTNNYVLSTNGSGVTSWVAQSGGGGSPGGSDTQVQFNDAGSFGGDADFTWNKTTNALTVVSTGTVTSGAFIPSGSTVPTTGIYLNAANQIGFATSSAAKMTLLGTGLTPFSDDLLSLGFGSSGWSDLFLASGGLISWANGNTTLTHSSGRLALAGAYTITSTSATALVVGANGATNPVLTVNANTASVATGISLTGSAAASRALLAVTSSGTDEGLSIDAKGAGTVRLGATSTGAIEFSRNAVPTASDGSALGTTALQWADLFLASGGVINWNNGNFTATHSADLLTFNKPIAVGVAGTNLGSVALSGNTSGTVTVNVAAAAGTWTMTLPTTGGTNGYFLQTNGSGVTTWASASAGSGSYVFISKQTASSSAAVQFTGLDTATYDSFEIVFENIVPATNNVTLLVQVGTGGTPTWQTTGYLNNDGTTTTGVAAVGTTDRANASVANTANIGVSGNVSLGNLASSSAFKQIRGFGSSTGPASICFGGYWNTATAITAVRLIFSSGNVSTGFAILYGRKNS